MDLFDPQRREVARHPRNDGTPRVSIVSNAARTITKAVRFPSIPFKNPPFLDVRRSIKDWELLQPGRIIMRILWNGVDTPPQFLPRPAKERLPAKDVQEAIAKLKDQGILKLLSQQEVKRTRYWVPLFTRPKKTGGVRLITDLRALNSATTTPHFKQNGLSNLLQILQLREVEWGTTLDLRDWFFHLGIHPRLGRWMRLRVGAHGYQFRALPFGYQASPYWTTKVSKIVQNELERKKIIFNWYVDDIIILGANPTIVAEHTTVVLRTLNRLGIRVNWDKSKIQPAQELSYLGLTLNLKEHTLKAENTEKIAKMALKYAKKSSAPPAKLSKLAGKVAYAANGHGLLVGEGALLARQAAYLLSLSGGDRRLSWHRPVRLPMHLRIHLRHLHSILMTDQPRLYAFASQQPFVMTTDASDHMWAAILSKPDGTVIHEEQGAFKSYESRWHITKKETLAALLGLRIALRVLPPRVFLTCRTDATTAVRCLNSGARWPSMNAKLNAIRQQLGRKGVSFRSVHVAGCKNIADALSRRWLRKEDYTLSMVTFNRICSMIGLWPTIDAFASRHNRKAKRYWTYRENALGQIWSGQSLFINPPWSLFTAVVRKLQVERPKEAIIIAPHWPLAPWWKPLQELASLHVIWNEKDIYLNYKWEPMPPPMWKTSVFAVLPDASAR
eukprot:TRINITY_DN3161_c0_g1_i12.p1 TRINITY_DN3161_c0_g1~~TRINITY_DN3161_c0_g1_i12.p1  ORF type:complete len:671 (+),score=49.04 TRINITY_DN3161_c0_g1_i12:806-2818(+)